MAQKRPKEGLYRIKLERIALYKFWHLRTGPKDFNRQQWKKILLDTREAGDVPVPLLVIQDPEEDRYLLEDGYRRYLAARENGLNVVTAQIISKSKQQETYPRFSPFHPGKLITFLMKVFGVKRYGLPAGKRP